MVRVKNGKAGAGSPTLDEVAQAAGVSRATASRAINGGNRVSATSQAAVEDAVRRLGYTPNLAARSLVTRRADSVAVVVPEPDERVFADPFFARTLSAINRVLSDRDLQLVLLLARPGKQDARLLRYLRNRHVDGAIVVSHHSHDVLPDQLADIGLPCTFVGRPWSGADRVSFVDTDNVEGGRIATQALIDRGCTRIATVTGKVDMTAGQDRLTGWRIAMGGAGLAQDAVAEGDFTEASGEAAARALLESTPDLDGIFVASDLMAAGVLRVLAERGRRVPRDVAVVGYDDLGVAERTNPPLTTVFHPVTDMATRATRLLLESLDASGPVPPLRVLFTPVLVRRESA